jgi:hypothetical protein
MASDNGGGNSPESWGEYRRLILSELKRLNETIDGINAKIERVRGEDMAQLKQDIALLKFQAAMWGAAAGALLTAALGLASRFIK